MSMKTIWRQSAWEFPNICWIWHGMTHKYSKQAKYPAPYFLVGIICSTRPTFALSVRFQCDFSAKGHVIFMDFADNRRQ